MFNKDQEELQKQKKKLKSTITEMKKTLKGINISITEAEEYINDLKYRMVKITTATKNETV